MGIQRVQQAVDPLSDGVSADGFFEKVDLLEKIEASERQIKVGETVSHDRAKRRLEKWLAP